MLAEPSLLAWALRGSVALSPASLCGRARGRCSVHVFSGLCGIHASSACTEHSLKEAGDPAWAVGTESALGRRQLRKRGLPRGAFPPCVYFNSRTLESCLSFTVVFLLKDVTLLPSAASGASWGYPARFETAALGSPV